MKHVSVGTQLTQAEYEQTGSHVNDDGSALSTGIQSPTGRTASYVIAASDSATNLKSQADFTCSGTNDDVAIQTYATLVAANGGTLTLLAGHYYGTTGITWTVSSVYGAIINMSGALFTYSGSGSALTFNEPGGANDGGGVTINQPYIIGTASGLNGILLNDNCFIVINSPIVTGFTTANSAGIRLKNTDFKCDYNVINNPFTSNNYWGICFDSNKASSEFNRNTINNWVNVNQISGGAGFKALQEGGKGVVNASWCSFNNCLQEFTTTNIKAFDLGGGYYFGTIFQTPIGNNGGAYGSLTFFDGITLAQPTIINSQFVGSFATYYGGNTGHSVVTESALANFSLQNNLGEVQILTNGDFSLGSPPSSWTAQNGATLATETTTVRIFPQSLKITSNAQYSLASQILNDSTTLAMVMGRTVNIELWLNCPVTNANGNGQVWITLTGGSTQQSANLGKTGNWQHVVVSIAAPATGITGVEFDFIPSAGGYTGANIMYINGARAWVSN